MQAPGIFPFISADRHLGGLYVLTIINSASVNFEVHVYFFFNYGFLKVYASHGIFNVKNNQ